MNLKELREGNCSQFIYRPFDSEHNHYKPATLVNKLEVINAVCKATLLITQGERHYVDSEILSTIEHTLSEYSEYKLTKDTQHRIGELTGFAKKDWSELLKT